ncbi:MAG: hypothetical protein AAGA87_05260 [Pseudomonadota bacterium]
MISNVINNIIEAVEPRLLARTQKLAELEKKVAAKSKQLERWEFGSRPKGPGYDRHKKRIDKSRAKIYDRIITVRTELESIWAEHGVEDITSVVFLESLENDEAIKAASASKWETLDEEMKSDASSEIRDLMASKNIDADMAKIRDRDKLSALLALLDKTDFPIAEEKTIATQVEKAVMSRIRELNRLDEEHERLIELVQKIRKEGGREITDPHKKELLKLLKGLPKDRRLEAEKEIATWPKWGSAPLMTEVLQIITDQDRGTDSEEAERGRFPLDEGDDVAEALRQGAKALKGKGNKCLSFLYDSGLSEVFSGDEELVEDTKEEYWKGQKERSKKTKYNARTLSRLASEARKNGLFGPVTVLEWTVSGGGYHTPSAGDVVNRLSNGKDGWYFFFCAIVSYHTVIIAVKKTGGKKEFQFIENGSARKGLDVGDITEEFDSWENKKAANSRIWQAYLDPQE